MLKQNSQFLFRLCAFLYSVTFQTAQGQPFEVTGYVYDETSKLPISAVNISVVGTANGTTTDVRGNFHLPLAPGIYTAQAQHIGYFTVEMKVRVPIEQPLLISLRPRTLVVPGVMIESTSLKQDTLTTNFVLTPRSLANAPALGEADALRAITLLPGAAIANDLKGELHVRGGGADENLIILDGMEIQNPFHLLGLFGAFNVEALQQIQFYPGLAPAQYGDRLSSALVLQSKPAQDSARVKANVSLLAASALLQKKFGNSSVTMALRRMYFDLVARAFGSDIRYHFYDGNFRLAQRFSPAWRMEATGFFNTDRVRPDSQDEGRFAWGNYAVAISLTRSGKKVLWQNHISLAKNYVEGAEKFGEQAIDNSIRDLSWRAQLRWQRENSYMHLGVFAKRFAFQYAWQGEASDDLENIFYHGIPLRFNSRRRQLLGGGFMEFNQRVNPILTFVAGVRASGTALENARLLPRLSVQFNMSRLGRWRFNYGETTQWQAYGREGREGAIGSPLFPLTQSLHARIASLAFEQNLPGRVSFTAELYHKKLLSVARLGQGEYPAFEYGIGKVRGLDVFVARMQGRLTFQAGYTWSEVIHTFGKEIYYADWDLRHQFKGMLGLHLKKNVSLHIVTQLHSGVPHTPAGGYVTIIRDIGRGSKQYLDWIILSGQRNVARSPRYIRIDLSLRKYSIRAHGSMEFYFQLLNVLFRRNVIRSNPTFEPFLDGSGKFVGRSNLQSEYGLPILPSFGISWEF